MNSFHKEEEAGIEVDYSSYDLGGHHLKSKMPRGLTWVGFAPHG